MENIIKKIKDDINIARKSGEKEKLVLLSTLYGEAIAIGKNNGNRETTDDETLKIISKFIKNNNETIRLTNGSCKLEEENLILSNYLPKQMSEEDLLELIKQFINKHPTNNIGKIMSELKSNYSGLYDGKMASLLIRQELIR